MGIGIFFTQQSGEEPNISLKNFKYHVVIFSAQRQSSIQTLTLLFF